MTIDIEQIRRDIKRDTWRFPLLVLGTIVGLTIVLTLLLHIIGKS